MTNFLRRPSGFPSGISAGGGDTGFDVTPQDTTLLKRVSQTTKDVTLPAGTVIKGLVIMPDPENPAAAGTAKIESWNITTNAAIATILAATDATIHTEIIAPVVAITAADELITLNGTLLTADTRYRITPAGIGAGTAALVGFKVMLPRIRT